MVVKDVEQYKTRELPRVPPISQNESGDPLASSNFQMDPDIRLPIQFLAREHAKSIIAIKELQNEVSSLLVLKDALLETFPHLHQRITGIPQDVRRPADLSDDIPGSWNHHTGSMPRSRKIRKSPEGSSTGSTVADSGFSTEKDSVLMQPRPPYPSDPRLPYPSDPRAPYPSDPRLPYPSDPSRPGQEVRWDTWTMSSSPPPGPEDELMSLLDVIHRKAVKLRAHQDGEDRRPLAREDSRKISEKSRPGHLGAISERSEPGAERAEATRRRPDRTDRDVLVDRISELESETIRSRSKVVRLETEIARVSKQKDALEDQLRISVGSKDSDGQSSVRAQSEGPGGIIHSVQILTGDSRKDSSPETSRILSQSDSNLRLAGGGGEGSVNIEIRQQDNLAKSSPMSRSSHDVTNRFLSPRGRPGLPPSVSVVNLGGRLMAGGSVDELRYTQRHSHTQSEHAKYFQNRITGPPMGGKLTPQLRRVLSNEKLAPKSRSVENLYNDHRIRSTNSEISLQPRHVYADHYGPRIKDRTQSEQVLTKIGKLEKVKLSQSVVSMPAELAKQHRLVVKPNRERIRQILSTNSVLELQRQLLTSVMENEVYKTQLGKITEAWDEKINDFEKVNISLQSSLSQLRTDNDQLKLQMEEKSIELEGTRARLRQLEKTPDPSERSRRTSEPSEQSRRPSEPRKNAFEPSEPSRGRIPESSSRRVSETSESRRIPSDLPTKPRPSPVDPQPPVKGTNKATDHHHAPPSRPKSSKPEPWKPTLSEKSEGGGPRRASQGSKLTENELTGRVTSENYIKYPVSDLRGPQVTFDLGPKKAKITEVPTAKRAVAVDRPASQLPSDARQRLQEMAGPDIKRNYRKSSDPTTRPNRLNVGGVVNGVSGKYLVSPPTTPTRTTSPATENVHLKRTSLTRKDSKTLNSAKNSLIMNYQNNNVKNTKNGGSSPGTRGGSGGNRTRTPSVERSLRSLGKDDPSKEPAKELIPSSKPPVSGGPLKGGRLLPAPPLEGAVTALPPHFTSIDIKRLEHDTIAELIQGILLKCNKKDETRPRVGDDTESEGSRPTTALRVNLPSRSYTTPTTAEHRSHTTPTASRGSATPRGTSWETFNLQEEVTHGSHTAATRQNSDARPNSSGGTLSSYQGGTTNYLDLVKENFGQDSLATLPDSLNGIEEGPYPRDEFQSPALYPDSLGRTTTTTDKFEDIDSLQLDEINDKQTVSNPSQTPSPDSLNAKISPAEMFFDSITLETDTKPAGPKRRIIPFCENSLSSGTSVFTSQDASFESKESSPPNNKLQQIGSNLDLYNDVTLNFRPLRASPAAQLNRFPSKDDLTSHNRFPGQDDLLADAVKSDQTKEVVHSPTNQNSSNLKTGMSMAKQATEKLKWKFLGW